jgi:preprotein translocase subunit SecE
MNIIKGQLSWVLIPISLYIIIYKKELIKYFSCVFICIAIIGTNNGYLFYLKHPEKINYLFLISLILHLVLLYPLINIQKYLQINYINYLLGIVGLIIFKILPYWPYIVSRETIIYQSIIIYVILTFISLFYNYNYILK